MLLINFFKKASRLFVCKKKSVLMLFLCFRDSRFLLFLSVLIHQDLALAYANSFDYNSHIFDTSAEIQIQNSSFNLYTIVAIAFIIALIVYIHFSLKLANKKCVASIDELRLDIKNAKKEELQLNEKLLLSSRLNSNFELRFKLLKQSLGEASDFCETLNSTLNLELSKVTRYVNNIMLLNIENKKVLESTRIKPIN